MSWTRRRRADAVSPSLLQFGDDEAAGRDPVDFFANSIPIRYGRSLCIVLRLRHVAFGARLAAVGAGNLKPGVQRGQSCPLFRPPAHSDSRLLEFCRMPRPNRTANRCSKCGDGACLKHSPTAVCSNPSLLAGHTTSQCSLEHRICFQCREPGHESTHCPLRYRDRTCGGCGQKGHISQGCPNREVSCGLMVVLSAFLKGSAGLDMQELCPVGSRSLGVSQA